MKKLERQGAMKDRQFSIKWSTSRRSSKELNISGPLELGKRPEWSSLGSDGPQLKKESTHLGGSMRRDPRKLSEGPRSRSLDARNLDGVINQRHINSQISRDISHLSESKRRLADSLPKDGEGNLVLHELFKREFIEKLSERTKQREVSEVSIPEDFVRPENFVKPIKIHTRHSRSESADLVQVIGSPKRDSFERVRVIELPRTPRSDFHEKLRSPSLKEKFADPEWSAKFEKLNVDHHQDHLDNHHRRSFSSPADDETSRQDFMLSKFFERSPSSATSKASPRELYDLLSNEEFTQQEPLSVDVLPTTKHSFRNVARKQALLVDEEAQAQRGGRPPMPTGSPLGRILSIGGGDSDARNSPSTASTASSSRGDFGSRLAPQLPPDASPPGGYGFERDRPQPGTLVESISKPPSRRIIERKRQQEGNPIIDYNSEEVLRTKEAMLKSLRVAAAVDQAHFLRTLQDQGAVQSSSPLRAPTPENSLAYARSLNRAPSDSSTSLKSPRHHHTNTGSKSPYNAAPGGSENVREVRGNAVEGSGAARASPSAEDSIISPDRWQDHPVELSASTQSSKIAVRRRRSGRNAEELPASRTETVAKGGEAVQKSSPAPAANGKSTVLQKIEKSRERRRRRAEKEAAAAAAAQPPAPASPGSSGSTPEQQREPEPAKINNSASKSWVIDNSASRSWDLAAAGITRYANSPSNNEHEDDANQDNKEDVKQSIIQKLMKRASARAALPSRPESGEPRDAQPVVDKVYAPFAYHLPPPIAPSAGVAAGGEADHQRVESAAPKSVSKPGGAEPVERSSSRNPQPSLVPSPKSDDPGPLKTPLSSIESTSNAEDLSGLLADLTGSVGLVLGESPSRELEGGNPNDALNNSLRVHVRNGPGQQQPQDLPESKLETQKSETVVECQQTPERTLSPPGPWSPGSDDSGSDGSSVDNQPSPVSVLNNSRTPFAENTQIGALESRINQLDQKLQESQERSQKISTNGGSERSSRDGIAAGRYEVAAPEDLINQEVTIVELNPEGTPHNLRTKPRDLPARPPAAKIEFAKPVLPVLPSEERLNRALGRDRSGYNDLRRSRESQIGHHMHAAAAAAVVSVPRGVGVRNKGENSTEFRKSLEIIAGSASDFRKSLEIFDLENIPTRGKRRWDLVYARDVLVASGFGRDVPSGPMTKWHSVAEPIDPSLFEKMEDYYKTGQKFLGCERLRRLAFYQPDHLMLAERIKASVQTKQGRYEPMHRCHLFDVVNELLAKKLGPYRTPRNPWLKPAVMRPRPTGKMLLEEIWRDICDQFGRNGSINDDQKLLHYKLECLIGEDLYKRSHWFPSPDFDTFVERIVAELEKRIFHDLVLETVATLQSI